MACPAPSAFVRATHGKISVERFESDSALSGVKSGLNFGKAYDRLWSVGAPYDEYGDSNVSAHFPYAARIWLAMWQHKTHEKLDGALAVDPQALAYLLAVTGPATLPDHSVISAGNVVQLTQQALYSRYPSDAASPARKRYLLDVARAASTKVIDARGNTTALVKAAGHAAAERRLLVYSTDPDAEGLLEQTSLSGAIPSTSAPFAGVVVNNDAGNKLDYYLDRSITWTRTGCGSTRDVTVTIRLTNTAPSGLPTYVEERNDHPTLPHETRRQPARRLLLRHHGSLPGVHRPGRQARRGGSGRGAGAPGVRRGRRAAPGDHPHVGLPHAGTGRFGFTDRAAPAAGAAGARLDPQPVLRRLIRPAQSQTKAMTRATKTSATPAATIASAISPVGVCRTQRRSRR